MKLAHVAVGRGTQNYTCDTTQPASAPKAVGALATLFNVTCLAASPQNLVAQIPSFALGYPVPTSDVSDSTINTLLSGHHFFTNATTPFFNLQTDKHNYGSVGCLKQSACDAPADAPKGVNGLGSVPWLKLAGFEGDYNEVYRVDTAGGNPPKTCQGMADKFQVEYAAAYYFFKQG
jgi:hypothetical protein